MRLTIVNQFYVPDLAPTGHMAASLAVHRVGLGDKVTVVTSAGGYVPQSPINRTRNRHANPRIHRLWTPRAGKASSAARLIDYAAFFVLAAIRLVTLPRQDIIISLTTPPYIAWTAVWHKLLHPSSKIVLWNMDCYPEIAERTGVIQRGGSASRFLRWLNRRLFHHLALVVCLDEAMRDLLRESYSPGEGSPAWRVIPNWEPASEFPPDAQPPIWEPARALGLDQDFVVLYLGNAGFGHSFETVMDSAERLASDDISFVFVGGGSKWPWIEADIERRKLDNVRLFSYVPKALTPSVMGAAGCALITMNDKAVGVVSPSKLHGSLAMGLPVLYIGPAGGNVHDAVVRFKMGSSFRHGDVEGVVGFVRHLASDPSFRHEMQIRARAAFDQAFSDQRTLPQFDDALSSLV